MVDVGLDTGVISADVIHGEITPWLAACED